MLDTDTHMQTHTYTHRTHRQTRHRQNTHTGAHRHKTGHRDTGAHNRHPTRTHTYRAHTDTYTHRRAHVLDFPTEDLRSSSIDTPTVILTKPNKILFVHKENSLSSTPELFSDSGDG